MPSTPTPGKLIGANVVKKDGAKENAEDTDVSHLAGALGVEVQTMRSKIDETEGAEAFTAREIMVALTRNNDGEEEVVPHITVPVQGEAPEELNAFSDGSLKNTKGPFWHLGGAGVWWVNREAKDMTEQESRIVEYKEQDGGVMLWCPFNSSLNSTTRCELAAATLALLAPVPVNIGIDNATVVLKGNRIIKHERRKLE